jgi:periplasmic protein TonB
MAYADPQGMSTSRIVAIVLVGLLHAFLAYALITGLAYDVVKQVKEKMEVIDVTEEKPPEEEPPPPPPDEVIVSPPPVVAIKTPAPTKNTTTTTTTDVEKKPVSDQPTTQNCYGKIIPANVTCVAEDPEITCPDGKTRVKQSQRASCPAKVEEVKKPSQKAAAVARGNPASWANTNDYPSRALSQEREGTTGFRVSIGADGRVTDCQITSSSGHADLDQATCSNVKRRARFTPAKDDDGNPTTGSYSNRIRWQIPKE